MKLFRTIRLDPSDTFVFARAAEPGEWAVPGGFVFANTDVDALEGKARSAFRAGFLGIASLGWSTLVQVVNASAGDRDAAVEMLAQRLCEHFGAPDLAAGRAAAEEEIAFAATLCDHPPDTLIAVHRSIENGATHEQFRTLRPRDGLRPFRAFSFAEVEGEDDSPADEIELAKLVRTESR